MRRAAPLADLRLRSCGVGAATVGAVASLLASPNCPDQLDLSGNRLSVAALAALSDGLAAASRPLQRLGLQQVTMGRAGLAALMPGMATAVHSLDLGFNYLRDAEMRAVAQGLCDATLLRRLSLRGRLISAKGAAAALTLLDQLPSLKVLDLRDSHGTLPLGCAYPPEKRFRLPGFIDAAAPRPSRRGGR